MTRTGLFRYVVYARIDDYHRQGWMVVGDLGVPHNNYSVLMWRASDAGCAACREAGAVA